MKATPVSATVGFGFTIVNVNDVCAPTVKAAAAGSNALLMTGGATIVISAEAAVPGLVWSEVTVVVVLCSP